MSIFERAMKKRQERASEIGKLNDELNKLETARERLISEINAAIDADDTALAENLVNQRRDIETKIEVAQLTIERRSVQNEDLTDLIEASNKETAEYQHKIDHGEAVVLAAKKEYLSKLLELASLVNDAWDVRTKYCRQIPGVEDPTTNNVQTRDFKGVHAAIRWDHLDNDLLTDINPAALKILNAAASDHYNSWVGRDHKPRDPGVTISKY